MDDKPKILTTSDVRPAKAAEPKPEKLQVLTTAVLYPQKKKKKKSMISTRDLIENSKGEKDES